jgi:hypothetical protein
MQPLAMWCVPETRDTGVGRNANIGRSESVGANSRTAAWIVVVCRCLTLERRSGEIPSGGQARIVGDLISRCGVDIGPSRGMDRQP